MNESENILAVPEGTLTSEGAQTYEQLCYLQLNRVLWLGSQDTKNSGLVLVMDANGMRHEVIRPDFQIAYINAVNQLVALALAKMKRESEFRTVIRKVETYEEAYKMFQIVLDYMHLKTAILGRHYETLYIDYDMARYKDDINPA